MPHKRDEIRKIIVHSLMNKTNVKENVFNWRIRPVQNDHSLPCISVVIPEEKVLEISAAGDFIQRQSDVYIVIYHSAGHNDDNMCDELSRQVERILNNLDSEYFDFKYKKTEISTENLSTKILILCTLHYECIYNTYESKEIKTDDLEQISIEVANG